MFGPGSKAKTTFSSRHHVHWKGPRWCHSEMMQAYTSVFERISLSVSPQQFCIPSRRNLHVITWYVHPPAEGPCVESGFCQLWWHSPAPCASTRAFTLNPASFRPSRRCLSFLLPQPQLRALHQQSCHCGFSPHTRRTPNAVLCLLVYLNMNILNTSFVMFYVILIRLGW